MTNEFPLLFSKRQKVCFVWHKQVNKFVFDDKRSDISEQEFESTYDLVSENETDFLKYNFAELKRIAIGSRTKPKAWLESYLKDSKESTEKEVLTKLLQWRRA